LLRLLLYLLVWWLTSYSAKRGVKRHEKDLEESFYGNVYYSLVKS
jgi:hypothetical protein